MNPEKDYLVSIIMPAYNEERTIEEIISKVHSVEINKEIIVINDGSKDKTPAILSSIKDKYNLKIINLEKNYGKGYAIRKGIEISKGEIILTQDADLETDPAEYHKLLAPIVEGKSKVVFGSRFLGKINNMNKFNYLGNKFMTFITNVLYGIRITDEATVYKIFLREVLDGIELKSKRFELCPELVSKIAKRKFKIIEIPISFNGRNKDEGKKLRLRDGIIAIWTLLKYRFID
ncbi:MAG: glycosyltransferase family 2 protein [Actinobacteria bacterium]|nr:glycosyltransferase family 2 protein [Actinomycetota bacterium]